MQGQFGNIRPGLDEIQNMMILDFLAEADI